MKKVKIIALISAVFVAVLLYNFLNNLSKSANVEIVKTSVATAVANIPPNTPITDEMISISQMPADAVHKDAVKDMDLALGKIASSQILEGEQVLSTKLVEPGEGNGTLAYSIETGMRAITIGVSNTTGLSNMIIPNNKVDIIGQYKVETTLSSGETKDTDYTVMLLENVKVLAVDSALNKEQKDLKEESYVTLTLQVSQEQAMKINMTETIGQLRVILRSPLDENITGITPVTTDKIIK